MFIKYALFKLPYAKTKIMNTQLVTDIFNSKKNFSKGVKEEKETENVTCGICY